MRPDGNKRLLDVGCGVGRFCLAARSKGWDVIGIDTSEKAVKAARELAGLPVFQGSVDDMLKEGKRFDVVTAFEVLEHLGDPVTFLGKLRSLIIPGGHLFCTVPNADCDAIMNSVNPAWLPPVHILFFNRSALKNTGDLAGLGDITTGVIKSDPVQKGLFEKARWMLRRTIGVKNEPLGLYLHARNKK